MVKVTNTCYFDLMYWLSLTKLIDYSSCSLICNGLLFVTWKCQNSCRKYNHKKLSDVGKN